MEPTTKIFQLVVSRGIDTATNRGIGNGQEKRMHAAGFGGGDSTDNAGSAELSGETGTATATNGTSESRPALPEI